VSKQSLPVGARVIFFDAVGTLIHPVPSAAEVYAAVGRRHNSRRTVEEIGPRFRTAFQREETIDHQRVWRTSEARERERWRSIVSAVLDDVADSEACFQELFEHFSRPEAWRCDPEVLSLFPELVRRGYTLGLASNYDRRLYRVLEGISLPYLQHVVISSEAGWRKPAKEFFLELSRTAGTKVEQIVYIGDDRVNDFDGACSTGLHAILFDPSRKTNSPEDRQIERLSELI
jgi:putative hydrolase of the HAD superfamily